MRSIGETIAARAGALREIGEPAFDPRGVRVAGNDPRDPRAEGAGDPGGRELAFRREQRRAGLVALADHARPRAVGKRVERVLDLGLDQGALLLDHDDLFEPAGEGAQALGFERPGHRRLVEAQADLAGERAIGRAHV